MATISVTDGDFEEKVLKSQIPVLVDFWAEWCAPCKMADPILEELSEQHKDKMTIVKVNVDENPAMPEKYEIMSIPTTVLIKNAQEVDRQVGFSGKQAYEDLIKKAFE